MESLMRRLAITTVVTVSLLMIHCDALKHDVGGTKYSDWGYDEPRINRQLLTNDEDAMSTKLIIQDPIISSSGGFCWQGMKLTVVVHELPPTLTSTIVEWVDLFVRKFARHIRDCFAKNKTRCVAASVFIASLYLYHIAM
ncbi:hypothetical protein MKW92_022261 [Papaver armeniacum]|nr:hypothetical protein MKW92_022261 [Papaver armeniacum]